MVLAGFVGGFGWFGLVPCFSNYVHQKTRSLTFCSNERLLAIEELRVINPHNAFGRKF